MPGEFRPTRLSDSAAKAPESGRVRNLVRFTVPQSDLRGIHAYAYRLRTLVRPVNTHHRAVAARSTPAPPTATRGPIKSAKNP